MTTGYAPQRTLRYRAELRLRRRGHRRLADIVAPRRPWWDWGHALMAIVGQDDCGNWSEPEPPTWYYRLGTGKRMWRTGYPTHPLRTIEVIKDYSTFLERTTGLNEDQMYEWKAICVNQDGDLHLGKQYWGGRFYGLNRWEMRLLARYLRHWRRLDWWGARSWLYSQALNAAVRQRKPCHRRGPGPRCIEPPADGPGGCGQDPQDDRDGDRLPWPPGARLGSGRAVRTVRYPDGGLGCVDGESDDTPACGADAPWVDADWLGDDGTMLPGWDGSAWCDEHRPTEVAS